MILTQDEFFYRIPGLLVPKNKLTPDLKAAIERFIDEAETISDSIMLLSMSEDRDIIVTRLNKLRALLSSVFAVWLEYQTEAVIIQSRICTSQELLRLLTELHTSVLTLSIDMQMAVNQATNYVSEASYEMEQYREIVNNMNAVSRLLDASDYMKAASVVKSSRERIKLEMLNELQEYIRLRKIEEAKQSCFDVTDFYKKKIVHHFGTEAAALRKILAVDDKPEILTTLTRVLKGIFQVSAVTSGQMALKAIEKQQPEAFLLDIDMPEMDGFELCEKIRELPKFKNTPVVFLTSNSNREYVQKALSVGGNDFIVKPFNKDKLAGRINKHFY